MRISFLWPFCLCFLAACNSSNDWRVKTQYRIHKMRFNGQEQVSGGNTDTFYYTADGKKDLSRLDNKVVEEKQGNVTHAKIFDAAVNCLVNRMCL